MPVALRRVLRRVHLGRTGRRPILRTGTAGVLAVHSLSKRDNFAGARIGFYAGDAELVHYLREVRKHAGLMPAGPVQAAAVSPSTTTSTSSCNATRYLARMQRLRRPAARRPVTRRELPAGAFYLWVPAPEATRGPPRAISPTGPASSSHPGEFYGPDGAGFFRVAAVAPEERIELAASRLAARLDG